MTNHRSDAAKSHVRISPTENHRRDGKTRKYETAKPQNLASIEIRIPCSLSPAKEKKKHHDEREKNRGLIGGQRKGKNHTRHANKPYHFIFQELDGQP